MWTTLIINPILNLLVFIWGILPIKDFGLALVVFTVLTRLLMWPLVRKQIRQTKVMRSIQPELKKIKEKYKDDRQGLAQAQMALYQSKGVNPFSSIGMLFVQLPLFFGVFSVVRQLADNPSIIGERAYSWVSGIDRVSEVIANPDSFEKTFFGIDLARNAFASFDTIYLPLVLIALFAGVMQFVTARMLSPTNNGRSLKEILKAETEGKPADQAEIMAASAGMMKYFLPAMIVFFAMRTTGSIALYLAASATIGYLQQKIIAAQKSTDTEADRVGLTTKTYTQQSAKKSKSSKAASRKSTAVEAEIVSKKPSGKTKKKSGTKKKKRG